VPLKRGIAAARETCIMTLEWGGPMRRWIIMALCLGVLAPAWAQQDKKTDDLKPADPDTGESTVEETTLGLLPNPFEKQGIKFALTYIGEVLGNPTGGAKQSAVYEDRINFAVDADLQKLFGLNGLTFHANMFRIDGGGLSRGGSGEESDRTHSGLAAAALPVRPRRRQTPRGVVRISIRLHVAPARGGRSPPRSGET